MAFLPKCINSRSLEVCWHTATLSDAEFSKKYKRHNYESVDVENTCDEIKALFLTNMRLSYALRYASQLVLGIQKIQQKQAKNLEGEVQHLLKLLEKTPKKKKSVKIPDDDPNQFGYPMIDINIELEDLDIELNFPPRIDMHLMEESTPMRYYEPLHVGYMFGDPELPISDDLNSVRQFPDPEQPRDNSEHDMPSIEEFDGSNDVFPSDRSEDPIGLKTPSKRNRSNGIGDDTPSKRRRTSHDTDETSQYDQPPVIDLQEPIDQPEVSNVPQDDSMPNTDPPQLIIPPPEEISLQPPIEQSPLPTDSTSDDFILTPVEPRPPKKKVKKNITKDEITRIPGSEIESRLQKPDIGCVPLETRIVDLCRIRDPVQSLLGMPSTSYRPKAGRLWGAAFQARFDQNIKEASKHEFIEIPERTVRTPNPDGLDPIRGVSSRAIPMLAPSPNAGALDPVRGVSSRVIPMLAPSPNAGALDPVRDASPRVIPDISDNPLTFINENDVREPEIPNIGDDSILPSATPTTEFLPEVLLKSFNPIQLPRTSSSDSNNASGSMRPSGSSSDSFAESITLEFTRLQINARLANLSVIKFNDFILNLTKNQMETSILFDHLLTLAQAKEIILEQECFYANVYISELNQSEL